MKTFRLANDFEIPEEAVTLRNTIQDQESQIDRPEVEIRAKDKTLLGIWEMIEKKIPNETKIERPLVVTEVGKVKYSEVTEKRPVEYVKRGSPVQRIIDSLVWWEQISEPNPATNQVAFVAGYKVSGTFNTYLSSMSTDGYITRKVAAIPSAVRSIPI